MALILTLGVLVALTVPMLALYSVSALEPVIARNLVDATRALYAAEAGIEWAFTLLSDLPDPDIVAPGGAGDPAGAPPATNTPEPGGAVSLTPPPDLLPWGTTSITVRDPGDAPGLVTVTSTGTVNGARRTVEVTVRRDPATTPGRSGGPGTRGQPRIVSWRER